MVRYVGREIIIDTQLLIIFYKAELKREPNNIANKVLLARSRAKLKAKKWHYHAKEKTKTQVIAKCVKET